MILFTFVVSIVTGRSTVLNSTVVTCCVVVCKAVTVEDRVWINLLRFTIVDTMVSVTVSGIVTVSAFR